MILLKFHSFKKKISQIETISFWVPSPLSLQPIYYQIVKHSKKCNLFLGCVPVVPSMAHKKTPILLSGARGREQLDNTVMFQMYTQDFLEWFLNYLTSACAS